MRRKPIPADRLIATEMAKLEPEVVVEVSRQLTIAAVEADVPVGFLRFAVAAVVAGMEAQFGIFDDAKQQAHYLIEFALEMLPTIEAEMLRN